MTTPLERLGPLALLAGLCFVALALRVWPTQHIVFPPADGATQLSDVRLLGPGAYTQLRHARYSAEHFPGLQRLDLRTNYPHGVRSRDVGLLDLGVAAAALGVEAVGLTPEKGRADALTLAVAWAPAGLGALAVAALYWLGSPLLGSTLALAAAAIFLLFPGPSLARTLLGVADRHAAEVALSLLSVGGFVRCLGLHRAGPEPSLRRPALLHALPLAAFLFTWAGAPVYLGLLGLALVGLIGFELVRGLDPRPSARAAFRFGVALTLLVGLPGLVWRDLVIVPRLFPFVMLGCLALAVGPLACLRGIDWLGRRGVAPRTAAWAGAAALVAGALSVRLVPIPETFSALLESSPLVIEELGAMRWSTWWGSLGLAGVLSLAAPPLVFNGALLRPETRLRLVPTIVGTLLILLWWEANVSAYHVPAFVALLAVFALVELAAITWPRGASDHGTDLARIALVALIVPVWPLGVVRSPLVPAEGAQRLQQIDEGWLEATTWLRDEAPRPHAQYGVLTAWEFGSFVAALADRPVVASVAADAASEWWMLQDEGAALEGLCRDCEADERVDYVILDARTLGGLFLEKARRAGYAREDLLVVDRYLRTSVGRVPHWTLGQAARRSVAARLYLEDGRDLGHFRLVFESAHRSYLAHRIGPAGFERLTRPIESRAAARDYEARVLSGASAVTAAGTLYDHAVHPSVKVFQRVAGARLGGDAAPGAKVSASLRVSVGDREFDYVRSATADAAGRFELTLAHASVGGAAYALFARTHEELAPRALGRIEVTEAQVRDGAVIELAREHPP